MPGNARNFIKRFIGTNFRMYQYIEILQKWQPFDKTKLLFHTPLNIASVL